MSANVPFFLSLFNRLTPPRHWHSQQDLPGVESMFISKLLSEYPWWYILSMLQEFTGIKMSFSPSSLFSLPLVFRVSSLIPSRLKTLSYQSKWISSCLNGWEHFSSLSWCCSLYSSPVTCILNLVSPASSLRPVCTNACLCVCILFHLCVLVHGVWRQSVLVTGLRHVSRAL